MAKIAYLYFYTGYTYVRAQSPSLDRTLRQELAAFSNDLRRNSGTDRNGAGQVSLEFYQKRKKWIGQEDIPWEVWTVRCELMHLVSEQERLRLQEKVGEMLSDKVWTAIFLFLICKKFYYSSPFLGHVHCGGDEQT